jgi:hypothetical protein
MGSRDPSQSVGPQNTSPLTVPEAELIIMNVHVKFHNNPKSFTALGIFSNWRLKAVGQFYSPFLECHMGHTVGDISMYHTHTCSVYRSSPRDQKKTRNQTRPSVAVAPILGAVQFQLS